jgi:hypothetical protein
MTPVKPVQPAVPTPARTKEPIKGTFAEKLAAAIRRRT